MIKTNKSAGVAQPLPGRANGNTRDAAKPVPRHSKKQGKPKPPQAGEFTPQQPGMNVKRADYGNSFRPVGEVAILAFPSNNKDKEGFPKIRKQMWMRMARKESGDLEDDDKFDNRPQTEHEDPLVFNSFEELSEHLRAGAWISKLYIQAHGGQDHISIDGKVISAEEFSALLLNKGGLADGVQKLKAYKPSRLTIRSLACSTGMDKKESDDGNVEGNLPWAGKVLNKLEQLLEAKVTDLNLNLTLRVKAPKKWQFAYRGKNIVFESRLGKSEMKADKACEEFVKTDKREYKHESPPSGLKEYIIDRQEAYFDKEIKIKADRS